MTVTTTTSRWEFTGDNSTTVFTYTNKIFADGDLTVTLDGVTQTLPTDYTVSGAGDVTGGNVTFLTAPGTDVEVVIVRSVADTQTADYPAGGSLPSGVIEDGIDRRAIVSQQLQEELDRALKYPSTDQSQPSATLPDKATRASKFAAYDSDGAPIAAAGTSADLTPVSAFMNTRLADIDAAAARTGYGLGTAAIVNTGTGGTNVPTNDQITGTPREFTRQQSFSAVALTDGANIAWVANTHQVAKITLGGNRTLDNPTQMKDGAVYILIVRQDGGGPRTLAYGSAYKFSFGDAPVLSTGINDVDILTFYSDGTSMFGVIQQDFS